MLTRYLLDPCSFNTTISIQFGGANFAIEPRIFSLGPLSENSTDCVGCITQYSDTREHILVHPRILASVSHQ